MTNKDISRIVTDRIVKSGGKPSPHLRFAAVNTIYWLLAGVSVFVGAIALAVSCYLLIGNDWGAYAKMGPMFLLRTMPLLWLVAIVLFVFLGKRYYRHTAVGHRPSLLLVLAVYVGAVVVLGGLMYAVGFGGRLDSSISRRWPEYRHIVWSKEQVWSNPEKGLLAGRIESMAGDEIELTDLTGAVWQIDLSKAQTRCQPIIAGKEMIKVIGHISGGKKFVAEEVRPWIGNGHGNGLR